MAARKGDRPDN